MTKAMDAADLLYGIKAIAAELGMRPKQAEHRIAQGAIPTFKMGRTVCASRAALQAWLAKQGAPDDDSSQTEGNFGQPGEGCDHE